MLAEDRYPDERIAELCEVSRATLARWKADGGFSARVDEITALYSDRALKFGLARRERRLQVLSDVHERVLTLIDARASDANMVSVPGGTTGLLVRDAKSVGSGKVCRVINVYTVDIPLLRELRAIEEQIAKELGQWTEKRELTGANGDPLIPAPMDLSKLSLEELKQLRNLAAKAAPDEV